MGMRAGALRDVLQSVRCDGRVLRHIATRLRDAVASGRRSRASAPNLRAAPGAPIQPAAEEAALRAEGYAVDRKHVATLMCRMGTEALYRKKSASKRHPERAAYRNLLRNFANTRANHVWSLDIKTGVSSRIVPMRSSSSSLNIVPGASNCSSI